ncbi:MAG: hypothetical protein OEY52_09130 [Gammaproteobacteria bacterium]|nr:hypothetical protein [Gammaproteobacteria bacterium]
MDSLSKFQERSTFKYKNRAAANLNKFTPSRGERLCHADASLYDIIPEPARLQPLSDEGIYSIKPKRYR